MAADVSDLGPQEDAPVVCEAPGRISSGTAVSGLVHSLRSQESYPSHMLMGWVGARDSQTFVTNIPHSWSHPGI